ncbi:MAG: zinc ribbon domain-containing protein, partial [Armatimonadota bacterium]
NRLLALQKDAELQLGSVETEIAQTNRILYGGTVVVPKELENLQKKLEELGRRKDSAEMTVLEAMETAQAADAEAATHEEALAVLARKYRKVKAAWQERSDALRAEMDALAAPRATAAAGVERADLLARHEAIKARKGGLGAALLEPDGSCSLCHTKVNTMLSEAVEAAATVEACEHCGRLLLPRPPADA